MSDDHERRKMEMFVTIKALESLIMVAFFTHLAAVTTVVAILIESLK